MKPPARIAAALVLVFAAGCGSTTSGPKPTPSAQIAGLLDQIDHTVAALPGVEKADADYQNTLDNAESARIAITLRSEDTLTQVREQTIRAFWTSRLRPIGGLTIEWTFQKENTGTTDPAVVFVNRQTRQDLTSRYGPRPQ